MEKKDMIISELSKFAIINSHYTCYDNNPDSGKEEKYFSVNITVKNSMLTAKSLAIINELKPSCIRLFDDGTLSMEIRLE